MKILFVSHQSSFVYGGEVVTLELLKELKKSQQIFFVAPEGPYLEKARSILGSENCTTISSIEFSKRLFGLPQFLYAWFRVQNEISKIFLKWQPDWIHAVSLKTMVYLLCVGRKQRVLWHHHNILSVSLINKVWLKLLAWSATKIVVPSQATKQGLLQAGLSEKKISVVYNGLDLNRWKARNFEEIKSDSIFVLGFIGEISKRKGADILLEVCSSLEGQGAWHCKVIGDVVSDVAWGNQTLEKLKDIKNVSVLGRREDISEQLQKIDLLIVPSKQDPLPTVIIEAFLSGVPVIAFPVGGIPEMLTDGVEGYLIHTPKEIVERIVKLMQDRKVYVSMAKNARLRAERQFSSSVARAEFLKLYERI